MPNRGPEHLNHPYAPRHKRRRDATVVGRGHRRRQIIVWTLGAVAIVVVACVAVAGLYLYRLAGAFDEQRNVIEMNKGDEQVYPTSDGVINVLVLGDDSRGEDQDEYEQEIGQIGERSDTMMLLHIPEDRSGIYVMSIMRDLWVDVPGQGEERISAAMSQGGPELAMETVEQLLQTHIDHVAVINFDGFNELTDALGGVYVDNPRAFSAGQRNPAFFPEGTIRLEGSGALRFVRERKAFSEGDYVRVENQQLVVKAIMDRLFSSEILTSPERIMGVVDGIVPYLSVDEGLDARTVGGYVLGIRDLRSNDVEFSTIPTGDPMTTTYGAQVLQQDEEAINELRTALEQETMDDYVAHLEPDGDHFNPTEGDFEGLNGDSSSPSEEDRPDAPSAP